MTCYAEAGGGGEGRRMMERVVVTGMGALTPVGLTARETWDSLLAGRSGIGPISSFDASALPVRIAGEVKGFEPRRYMDHKVARRMGRFAQFAVACSVMALEDAGLSVTEANAERIPAVINTGGGGAGWSATARRSSWRSAAPARSARCTLPLMAPNMVACQPSIVLGLRGPVVSAVAACAAGVQAFAEAAHILRRGEADVLLTGGAESGIVSVPLARSPNASPGDP
ncbi:MAG: beta-ketoacyl synthase N-terminal-like domain-containing protein [Dehalococcoidia bacterium]